VIECERTGSNMLLDDAVKVETGIRRELQPFEELFKLHRRNVYAVCLGMTRNTADAEDLSQEVFLQVLRKLNTFRGESSFATWLHRLTVNHVLMYFRRRRCRREQLTEGGELPEPNSQDRRARGNFPVLDRIALNEAIGSLAPGYRTVLVLHDIQGLEHHEIASILGCSVGTTKSQLHKARMKLRGLLRQRPQPCTTAGTDETANADVRDLCLA